MTASTPPLASDPSYASQSPSIIHKPAPNLRHPPTLSEFCLPVSGRMLCLEYSIHAAPARLARELRSVFPDTAGALGRCLVVPTFQQCKHDLVGMGEAIDRERDEKLEMFIEWGKTVCEMICTTGHWADLTDPASGYPVFSTPGPSLYPDVIGAQQLLHYDVQNANCCKVLLHPRWGSHVYPGTLFTTADQDILERAIDSLKVAKESD